MEMEKSKVEVCRIQAWESEEVYAGALSFIIGMRFCRQTLAQVGDCDRNAYICWIGQSLLSKDCYFYAGFVNGCIAGVVWAIPLHDSSLQCHQLFVPERKYRRCAAEIGRLVAPEIFADNSRIEYLMAFTPTINKRAVIVQHGMGFRKLGELPNYINGQDVVINYMRRP